MLSSIRQSLHPAKFRGLEFISDFAVRWCEYQCTEIYLEGGLLHCRSIIQGKSFCIMDELVEERTVTSLQEQLVIALQEAKASSPKQ